MRGEWIVLIDNVAAAGKGRLQRVRTAIVDEMAVADVELDDPAAERGPRVEEQIATRFHDHDAAAAGDRPAEGKVARTVDDADADEAGSSSRGAD